MNKENQNIEWKESWRDEYIKWVCGFANASGGKIYIGTNNNGHVTGVTNAANLLETIPNKNLSILGIIVDVNLLNQNNLDYVEIIVEAYPYPIGYKGQYHYRSGSTKQELKGSALDKFLLQKQGKHWDGIPAPFIAVADLQNDAFIRFKHMASKSNRLSNDVLYENNSVIIDNLHFGMQPFFRTHRLAH